MKNKAGLYQYETHQYTQAGEENYFKMPKDLKVDPKELRRLSKLSSTQSFLNIGFDWGFVALVAHLQHYYLPVYFYPLTALLIATRQQALGIILHDASHFLLVRNRKWNDFLADWLLAFPLSLTTFGYRREHFAHHKYSGSGKDPDHIRLSMEHYQDAKTSSQLAFKLIKLCSGLYLFREIYEMPYFYQLSANLPNKVQASRIAFWILAASFITRAQVWIPVLLYWFIPLSTFLMSIVYFRLRAEHDRVPEDRLANTRNVHASVLERFIFGQHNTNLHLDHHLFPSVPFYNLPRLHQELLKNERYQMQAHQTNGYFTGLWNELVSQNVKEESAAAEVIQVELLPRGIRTVA